MSAAADAPPLAPTERLSTLDRLLPVWIGLAMAGSGEGAAVPRAAAAQG